MNVSIRTPRPLNIEQNPDGYRYSVEPFLLAHRVRPASGSRILEVGAGCGILSLLLSARDPSLRVAAVEIQQSLFLRARQNVSANHLDAAIEVIHGDFLKTAGQWSPETFDWILSNPPYRKKNSGRVNPCPEKAVARHELALTLEQLVETAALLLKAGGRLALAYPANRRAEVLDVLRARGLGIEQVIHVCSYRESSARFFLVQAVRGAAHRTPREDQITIYQPDGSYTPQMQEIYASFNYSRRPYRVRKK